MHFHHPPAKKYRLIPQEQSPIETLVLHLSPYGIGRMGGEMAKRMVDAAQNYLEEVTTHELKKAFRQRIQENHPTDHFSPVSVSQHKKPFSTLNYSGDGVHANQYPSEIETH
jgi:hypothetical protein